MPLEAALGGDDKYRHLFVWNVIHQRSRHNGLLLVCASQTLA